MIPDRPVETPALLLDLDVMEKNISRMADLARRGGVSFRPHIKTHKSLPIAHRQLLQGARGVTAATLAEAELMAQGGIRDILLAYPPVGSLKLKRLLDLAAWIHLTVALDSMEVAGPLAAACRERGMTLDVYLKIDTGLGRTGKSPEGAVELARELKQLEPLQVVGIMSHCGFAYGRKGAEELARIAREDGELMVQTKEALEKIGIPIREVSVGSTPTCWTGELVPGVTEIRPGTYVFNDASNVLLGIVGEEDCAAAVLATVISRPTPRRVVIDAGSKSVAKEASSLGPGFGIVKNLPGAVLERVYEEHGVIELPADSPEPAVGDLLAIIPNHICPVVNLFSQYILLRQGKIAGYWPIGARR
ncbi:MAG: alanine racemase [Firmicutes bacterium]|nr:alanine racemase [Bacillota bacterium]